MTEPTVDLTFLGEQMKALQGQGRHLSAEMALVREKVVLVESGQVEIRENLSIATGEFTTRMVKLERGFAGLEQLVGGLSTRVDGLSARVDNYEAANNVRFDQMQKMAATNLEIVLTMLKSLGDAAKAHEAQLNEHATLKGQGALLNELVATLKNLDRKFDSFIAERKS